MTDWASGYVADIDYIPGFYAEQMPLHLDLACHLQGIHPPRREGEGFTYCELGCGLGETALTLAACHPEAEIHAFDFNPSHMAYAVETARRAGLSNVHFAERSFADLARSAEGEYPLFDYVTLHGIWTWISREHQLEIVEVLSRFVRPGGVVAVTYNAQPGWGRQMALQRLLYDFASRQEGRSDLRVESAIAFAEAMRRAGSLAIDEATLAFLAGKGGRNFTYLAHEYLNGAWQPAYHADVAADMGRAKLSYVGSATLLENFPLLFLTEAQRELVSAAPAHMRETVKDHFYPRIFRRDIFVRGARAIAPLPKARILDNKRLTLAGALAQPETKLTLPSGEVEFKSPFYAFMAEALSEGDASLAEIRARPGAPPAPQSEELLAIGYETRNAVPIQRRPTAVELERLRAANLAFIGSAVEHGRPSSTLAAFAIGSGLRIHLLSMLAYEALATGTPEEVGALATRCVELLVSRGEHLRRDGEIVRDPARIEGIMRETAERTLALDLPHWRRIGAF